MEIVLLQPVYRKDYKPTPYLVDHIYLDFNLNEDKTRVKSKLSVNPNYEGNAPPELSLDGKITPHFLLHSKSRLSILMRVIIRALKKTFTQSQMGVSSQIHHLLDHALSLH